MSAPANWTEMTQLSPQPAPAKITPRIFGGLGNQLFCYAAARRLALVNNAELVLDDVSGFTYDDFYQRHYQLDHFSIPCRKATPAERLEPYHRVRRYLKRRWNQRKPFAQRAYLVQAGIDFDPSLLHFKPKGTVYLEGYWQSEEYFMDVADTLRQDFRIISPPMQPTWPWPHSYAAARRWRCMGAFLMNPAQAASATRRVITRAVQVLIYET